MPVLANLGQHLLAAHPAPAAPEFTGHLLHLICKAYRISIVADLSPHQASQASIVQWGTFLLQVVGRIVPEEAQPADKDDREDWSWWKAKKWAHHAVSHPFMRQCRVFGRELISSMTIGSLIAFIAATAVPRSYRQPRRASSLSQRTLRHISHRKFSKPIFARWSITLMAGYG